MMKPTYKKLHEISQINISHGTTLKMVLMSNEELHNTLTQIAYGIFRPGEKCELHNHPTMFEYFFFIEGNGKYLIDDRVYEIDPGTFIEIPPTVKHKLSAGKDQELKFIYWGLSTD